MDELAKSEAKPRRARKQASIMEAARDLFLADGYERTSVDAIAARAGVSKRTVYDYYGDKQALLVAVLDAAGQSLMVSVNGAIEQHLRDVDDLEAALTAFARQVATDTFASSDFVVLRRLLFVESSHLPDLSGLPIANAPEDALARCFQQLTEAGRVHAPDARLAADHFIALTFLLALDNSPTGPTTATGRVDQVITAGVPAFLRAYAAPRP